MGAAAATGSRRQPEPEINITPLVDVVLVLLIIFMVVAPELEHGERVELPAIVKPDENAKGRPRSDNRDHDRARILFVEKESVADLAALGEKLKEIRTSEPDRRIVLKGDSSASYKQMRETFAVCQKLGFPGVSLSVSQRGRGGEEG